MNEVAVVAASQRLSTFLDDEDAVRLFTADDTSTRIDLYLRLLYSRRYSAAACAVLDDQQEDTFVAIPSATRALLATIDYGELAHEQAARARNVRHALEVELPCSIALLRDLDAMHLVRQYCDAPAFWRGVGRSLAENFAVFVVPLLETAFDNAFIADMTRLEGSISGLRARPRAPSPWRPDATTRDESFTVRYALLPDDEELPHPNALPQLMSTPPSPHLVRLTIEADSSLLITCIPHCTQQEESAR